MSLTGLLLRGFGPAAGESIATPTLEVTDNGDGTVTATVSGSTSGTTNTLYYETQTAATSGGTWTAAGSCTGDGAITATLPGDNYFFYVGSVLGSDSTVSNMEFLATAVAPASVHWLCLQAAQSRIQALNLAGVAGSSIVIKKMALSRFLGTLKQSGLGVTLPAVVLIPLSETQDGSKGVNSLDDVAYGVGCLAVSVDNQEPTVAAMMASFLTWRQQINRAIRNQNQNTFPSLPPTIQEMTVTPKQLYDQTAWASNYDLSYLELRFRSREPRGLNA